MLYAIIVLQAVAIGYLIFKQQDVDKVEEAIKEKDTAVQIKQIEADKEEELRKIKIEKSWQKLFNYNEDIATRGYTNE